MNSRLDRFDALRRHFKSDEAFTEFERDFQQMLEEHRVVVVTDEAGKPTGQYILSASMMREACGAALKAWLEREGGSAVPEQARHYRGSTFKLRAGESDIDVEVSEDGHMIVCGQRSIVVHWFCQLDEQGLNFKPEDRRSCELVSLVAKVADDGRSVEVQVISGPTSRWPLAKAPRIVIRTEGDPGRRRICVVGIPADETDYTLEHSHLLVAARLPYIAPRKK